MLSVSTQLWIGDGIPPNSHFILACSLLLQALNAVAYHYFAIVRILVEFPPSYSFRHRVPIASDVMTLLFLYFVTIWACIF